MDARVCSSILMIILEEKNITLKEAIALERERRGEDTLETDPALKKNQQEVWKPEL